MSRERLIARFAVETPAGFNLMTRYASGMEVETLPIEAPAAVSIQPQHPAAAWFERKIQDEFGITFESALDNRPLLFHEHVVPGQAPMRKAYPIQQPLETTATPKPYPYEVVEGDSTYEIAVGPIHAGIIEPGHFHFSQAGEHILHQEVRHFYKWRGIEKMLEDKTPEQALPVVARISGHSSLAYQWAFTEAMAQANGQALSEGQQAAAATLLELERLAHHFTDLGFIPNDAGFASALAWGSVLAEQVRRMLKEISGHRFGFDAFMRPLNWNKAALTAQINLWQTEIHRFAQWIETIPSLWDRLDTTGKLKPQFAEQFDVVGIVARASGLARDVRSEQPLYQALGFTPQTQPKGDVAARFRVRLKEADQSLSLIAALLPQLDSTATPLFSNARQHEDGAYEARIESVLGEVYMWVQLEAGQLRRFYVRDPSFVNWQALHLMMPGNIIADFPLINKSCDLSYAGNDL